MNRRQEREQAFVFIFEKEFNPDLDMQDIFDMAAESEFAIPGEFAMHLCTIADEHREEIDRIIEDVSIGWNKKRISKVSLAILRLAVAEIKYMEDIPVSVSINEAVELSKKYAGTEDSSFVNGILGTVARS